VAPTCHRVGAPSGPGRPERPRRSSTRYCRSGPHRGEEEPMTRTNPMVWLGRTARRGLTDLPRNILWALDAGVTNPARSAGQTVQAAGQRAATAVADVNPFGDRVERRSNRVDSAMERVHELELRAHEAAREAKERADALSAAEEEGSRQLETARDDA